MNPRNRLTTAFFRTRDASTAEEPRVPSYRVGEPFVGGRRRWPEGAQYLYGRMGHELTLFVSSPAPELVEGVRRGEARFALGVAGPIFYLAYRFEGSRGWSDVPYSWHLQHRAARATPPGGADASPDRRALLWISLVGADDGLIHAQRGVTLSPEFTRELHRAIRAQAEAPFDPLECAQAIAEASRERPDADRRLDVAYAWSVGNA